LRHLVEAGDPRCAYRAATVVVNEYGDEAPLMAARRCDALLANGKVDGERVWKGILRAAEELRRTKRRGGERGN
jgi:hypothetical protein